MARDLRMTVAGLLRDLSVDEYAQWRALYVVEAEEKARGWSQQDELQASLLERLDFWGRQMAVLQGVKKSDLPKPLVIPRPRQPRQVETDTRKIAAWFSEHVK